MMGELEKAWADEIAFYIRKAVELADGWGLVEKKGRPYALFAPNTRALDCQIRYVRDALAAQLVRQVDALYPDLNIQSDFGGCTFIYKESTDEDWHEGKCQAANENDRTMNTIRAIVDSGVLKHD